MRVDVHIFFNFCVKFLSQCLHFSKNYRSNVLEILHFVNLLMGVKICGNGTWRKGKSHMHRTASQVLRGPFRD